MQVHGPSRVLKEDGSEVHAHLNGDFVDMTIGDVHLYIRTPEECDWLIATATKARGLLAAKRTPVTLCPAFTGPDDELDQTVYCDRKDGHPGNHHGAVGDGAEVAWPNEPEPAPELCHYCDVEPATVSLTSGRYCEACAPAVHLVTGADVEPAPELKAAS